MATKNIYINSSFTEESVTGQTSVYTGEALQWGVNAFDSWSSATAAGVLGDSGTIYTTDMVLGNVTLPDGYSLSIDKGSVKSVTGSTLGTSDLTIWADSDAAQSGIQTLKVESITGINAINMQNDWCIEASGNVAANSLVVNCVRDTNNELVSGANVAISSVSYSNADYKSIVDTDSILAVNTKGAIYVKSEMPLADYFDTRYNTWIFVSGENCNVTTSAFKAFDMKSAADREIVLTSGYKTAKEYAVGHKIVVDGASVASLYGDSADEAASADLTVYGNDSAVTSVIAARTGITGNADIKLTDASVALIDGSMDKVGGTSSLLIDGKVSGGTVQGFDRVVIAADSKLNVETSATATSFIVNVDGYTGGSRIIVDAASINGSASLSGETAGFEIFKTDTYIAVKSPYITDVYVCTSWTESTAPVRYGDIFIVWNHNALNSLEGIKAETQNITIIGDYASGIDAGSRNLSIDSRNIGGDLTGTASLSITGTADIKGSISGFETITVDASGVSVSENSYVRLVGAEFEDYKKITVTGTDYKVVAGNNGVYLVNNSALLDTVYCDTTWDESITGTTHSVTGEELIWGYNAFNSLSTANSAVKVMGTIYAEGNLSAVSFDSQKPVNAVVSGYTLNTAIFGGTVTNFVASDLRKVSFTNSVITGMDAYLLDRNAGGEYVHYDDDIEVEFIGSTVGNVKSDGSPFYLINGANVNNVTITMKDCYLAMDFKFFQATNFSSNTDQTTMREITWNIINSSGPARWTYLMNGSESWCRYATGHFVINVIGFTIDNGGNHRIAVASENNETVRGKMGPIDITLSAVSMSGGTVFMFSSGSRSAYSAGKKTLHVVASEYGADTVIAAVYQINELQINANASLTANIIAFQPDSSSLRSCYITIDASDYTGSNKLLINGTTAFVTGGETPLSFDNIDITITGDTNGRYETYLDTTKGQRIFLVDKLSDVYVNAGYVDATTGTTVNGDVLVWSKNAFADMDSAYEAMATRPDATIHYTGDSSETPKAVELNANGYKLIVEGGSITKLYGAKDNADSVNVTVIGGVIDEIVMAENSVSGNIALTVTGGEINGDIDGSNSRATGTTTLNVEGSFNTTGDIKNFDTIATDATNLVTAKSVAATNITIDASEYALGSTKLFATEDGVTGTYSITQAGDQYSVKASGKDIYLASNIAYDTYFSSTWNSSIDGKTYEGNLLQWNIDAFNNFADALANVQSDYTIYMVGGSADAMDLSSVDKVVNLTVDGTDGASLKSITGGDSDLALNGTFTFAAGSAITGFSDVTYTPAKDTCLTIDSIAGLEDGTKWTIDVSNIEIPAGQQIVKIIDTNADISNVTFSQKGETYGIYCDGQDVYAVRRDYIYLNADYTEAITGTTHAITGEVLYYGANAFSTATAARDAMSEATKETAKVFYVEGIKGSTNTLASSIYGSPFYEVILTDVVASGSVYAGSSNNVSLDYEQDQFLTITGSTLKSFRGFDQGKTEYPQTANCNLTIDVKDSLFTGYCFAVWGDGTGSVVTNTLNGDFTMNVSGTTFGDRAFFTMGNVGTYDTEAGAFGDLHNININVKGSTFAQLSYMYRLNANTGITVGINEYNLTLEDSYFAGGLHVIYSDDLDNGLENTHITGNFTVTYVGSTVNGSNWVKCGDLTSVEGGTFNVVIANREGHNAQSTLSAALKGFDNLTMEHGAAIVAGTSIHANHSYAATRTLATNWDSYVYATNGVVDFTNVKLDMEGYTNGTYLLIDAGAFANEISDFEILNDPGTNYTLTKFAVNGRQRVFVVGTTGSCMYVNSSYDQESVTVNGTQNEITGEYLFKDGALSNNFWNVAADIGTATDHASEIGATGIVITGGTYEYDITGAAGMDLYLQAGSYQYTVTGAENQTLVVSSGALVNELVVSGSKGLLDIGKTIVAGDISASNASVTIDSGAIISDLTGGASLTIEGDLTAGSVTGVTGTTITATGSISGTKFAGTNLVIDITGYTGDSRTIMEASDGIDYNHVSIVGGTGYVAQVLDKKINLVARNVTDTYCNTTWTSKTTPESLGGVVLIWDINAFADVNSAISAAAAGSTVYFLGTNGGDVADTMGKVLYVDGSTSAVSLGNITGTGTIILKGNVTVGDLTGFSNIQYIAVDGTKLTGGVFTLAEGGKFTVDASGLTYDGCGTNLYNVVSGVTGASFSVTDTRNRFKIYDGTSIGGSADDKYLLNMEHVFFDHSWTEAQVKALGTDATTGDYLFWNVNAIASSKTNGIKAVAKGGTFYCYYDTVGNAFNGISDANYDYAPYVTGCTFNANFWGGWKYVAGTHVTEDYNVYYENVLFTGGTVMLAGCGASGSNRQTVQGDLNIYLKSSTVHSSGWWNPVHNGMYYTTVNGDVNFTMEDSIIATDICFGGSQSVIYGDLNINLINTVAPADKWIAARSFTSDTYTVKDINVRVLGSSFANTTHLGTNWNNNSNRPQGEIMFEFSGSTIMVLTSSQPNMGTMAAGCESSIRNTLYVSVTAYGSTSAIGWAYGFDYFKFDAAAYLTGSTITVNKDATLEINAEGYTGGSRWLTSNMSSGFSALPVSYFVSGSTEYDAYVTTNRVAIVSRATDVYVNSAYNETDTVGIEIDGELIFYGLNASSSIDDAYGLAQSRIDSNVCVTGGTFDNLEFENQDTIRFISGTTDVAGVITVTNMELSDNGHLNGEGYAAITNLTIDATSKLTTEGDITVENLTVDLTDYVGSGKVLLDSSAITISNPVTIIGDPEGAYEILNTGSKLLLVSSIPDNTFFNVGWNSSLQSVLYGSDQVIRWGINAYNNLADATANVVEGSTIFMIGGSISTAITASDKNYVFDGNAYSDIAKSGAAVVNGVSTTGSVTVKGDVTFTTGGITASEFNYTAAEGKILTVDAITLDENAVITIDASELTAAEIAGTNLLKVVATDNGITAGSVVCISDGFGAYSDGKDIYVIDTRYVYLDASYTAETTGTTNAVTGETMYYGVNAFSNVTDAKKIMTGIAGGTLFVTGSTTAIASSIYGATNYDVVLVGASASTVYAGSDNAGGYNYTTDKVVTIKNSTVAAVRVFDQGLPIYTSQAGTAENPINVTLTIEDSSVSGLYTPNWGEGTDCTVNTHYYGDFTMTVKNSKVGFGFIGYGSFGDSDHLSNATIVLDNVYSNNTWWGVRMNANAGENQKYFNEINVTATGYTGTGSFQNVCYWAGASGYLTGNFVTTMAGSTIGGEIRFSPTSDTSFSFQSDTTSVVYMKNIEGYDTTISCSGLITGAGYMQIDEGVTVQAGTYLSVSENAPDGFESQTIYMDVLSSIIAGTTVTTGTIRIDTEDYMGENRVVIAAGSTVIGTAELVNDNNGYRVAQGSKAVVVYHDDNLTDIFYANDGDKDSFTGVTDQYTGEIMVGEYNAFNNWDDAKNAVQDDYKLVVNGGTYGEVGEESNVDTFLYADGKSVTITGGTFLTDVYACTDSEESLESVNLTVSGGAYGADSVIHAASVLSTVYGDASIYLEGDAAVTIDAAADYVDGNAYVYVTADSSVNAISNADAVIFDSNFATLTVKQNVTAPITVDVTGYDKGGGFIILKQNAAYTGKVTFEGDDLGVFNYFSQLNKETGLYELYVYDTQRKTNTYVNGDWTDKNYPGLYNGEFLTWNKNAFNDVNAAINALDDKETWKVWLAGGTLAAIATTDINFAVSGAVKINGSMNLTNGTITVDTDFLDIEAGTALCVIDVDGSITADSITLTQTEGYASYVLNNDFYVTKLSGNAYYDAAYDASITGTTTAQGDVLVYGVNAFTDLNSAVNATATGATIFAKNYVGEFNFNRTDSYNAVLTGGSYSVFSMAAEDTTSTTRTSDGVTIIVDGADFFTSTGLNLLGSGTWNADVTQNIMINGPVDVLIKNSTVGQLHIAKHAAMSEGFSLTLENVEVQDSLEGLIPDGRILGGTVDVTLKNVSLHGQWLNMYSPSWTFDTTGVTFHIENTTANAGSRIGVLSSSSTSGDYGTVDYYISGSTLGSVRGGRVNGDSADATYSTHEKTLHFIGGDNVILGTINRINYIDISGVDTTVTLNAASYLQDDTYEYHDPSAETQYITIYVNSKVMVDVTGYTAAQKEVFTAVSGMTVTDNTTFELEQDEGAGYSLAVAKHTEASTGKTLVDRIVVYKASVLTSTYLDSDYTAAVDGTYAANGDLLVYGVNAFSDQTLAFAHAAITVGSMIFIENGIVSVDSLNVSNSISLAAGASISYSGEDAITIHGAFTNNGEVSFNPYAFAIGAAGYTVVLTADSDITGEGTYVAGNGKAVYAEGKNAYLVHQQKIVYVDSSWKGTEIGAVVSGHTYGIDAFGDFADANAVVVTGGTIVNGKPAENPIPGGVSGSTINTPAVYASGEDVAFESDVISGTIYAGNATNTPEDKNVTITDTTASRAIVGENFNGVDQSDSGKTAEIYATVEGGTFDKGILAGDATNATINANTDITVNNTATRTVLFGGMNFTAGTEDAPNNVTINGDSAITLTDVTNAMYTNGGSLITHYGNEVRNGDITINIDGGSFASVSGGSLIQSSSGVTDGKISSKIDGDITMNISGAATIGSVYAGSGALKASASACANVTGNVSVTIDVTEGAKINNYIFVGGMAKSTIGGDATLTIKGSGDGTDYLGAKILSGESSYAKGSTLYVYGEKSLVFNNFSGQVTGRVAYFDTITIDATSQVEFSATNSYLDEGLSWNISADKASNVSVNLTCSGSAYYQYFSFAGSELNFNCDEIDNAGTEWTIFRIENDDLGYPTISSFDGMTATINGEELEEMGGDEGIVNSFESDTYRLEYRIDENNIGTLVAFKLEEEVESDKLELAKLA